MRAGLPGPAAGALTLLLAVALSGCAPSVDLRSPNLVLITIDTLRADHLGCYGYFRDTSPELDSFARESLLFERCHAPISTTFPSHLSLLTSTYPGTHGSLGNVGDGGAPFDPEGPLKSIAQLAASEHYLTAGFVSATPVKKYTGISAGFHTFDAPGRGQRDAAATNAAVLPWLESGSHEEPFFLWIHYFDPHSPYAPPGEFRTRFTADKHLRRRLLEREVDVERRYPDSPDLSVIEAVDLYDGEVAFVDREVGRVLDELRSRDLWDRTVVVVVADHGEGLGQHDDLTHGGVWREHLHVPLLIRIPGVPGRRIEERVSTVDVLPMLEGLVGLPGGEEILAQSGGIDRLHPEEPAAPVFGLESTSGHRTQGGRLDPDAAIVAGRWKLIHDPGEADLLFDLRADPFELRNIAPENPDTARALRDRLVDELARQRARNEDLFGEGDSPESTHVDTETLEQLRALGYAD